MISVQSNLVLKFNMITVRNEVAKVMFLQVSVCPQGGGVLSQHALQVVSQHALQQVSGGGWVSQHALQVSRPTPKGEV